MKNKPTNELKVLLLHETLCNHHSPELLLFWGNLHGEAVGEVAQYHGGQPVGATVSCAHFQNGVDSRALYPGASSEGSRQRSNVN